MKRITAFRVLPLILVITLIFGTLAVGLTAFAAANYDVDNDGSVAVSDVSALLDYIAGSNKTPELDAQYDFDGDGQIAVGDVSALLDYIANPVQEETMQDIVDAAYALEGGASMAEQKTLTGKIVKIDTAYNAQYGNITVTIVVEGREDKPIQCYRLKGAEATENTPAVDISGLAVLDKITVTGTLKNYVKNNVSTIEFDAGCICSEVVPTTSNVAFALNNINFESSYSGGSRTDAPSVDDEYEDVSFTYTAVTETGAPAPVTFASDMVTFDNVTTSTMITVTVTASDGTDSLSKTFTITIIPAGQDETMEDIVNAAYALESGASMTENKTLQGVITVLNQSYSAQYGNISVTIVVGDLTDKPIQCYRMVNGADITAGEGVEVIKIGDTITVTGKLKNYNGTIEFDTGCTLDSLDEVGQSGQTPTTPEEIVAAAYALDTDTALSGTYTLSGRITEVNVAYSEQYGNINVTIVVGNMTDKPILCYRMVNGANITAGEGIEVIKVGDVISVKGSLKNYHGTVEFDTGCTLESIDEAYQLSDQEKVDAEKTALTITPEDGITLPISGATYGEVQILWSLPAGENNVTINKGKLMINNTGLTQGKDVVLTATLSLNNAVATKTFTVSVLPEQSGDVENKTWSLTFPDDNADNNKVGSYTAEWTAIIGTQTWEIANFNNNNWGGNWTFVKAGRKAATGDGNNASVATITTTFATGTVQNIVVNLSAVNADYTNSIKLYVKSAAGETLATVEIDEVTAGEHTFAVPAAIQAAGLTYVLEFDLAQGGSSNGFTVLNQVDYNGFAPAGETPPACEHNWSEPTYVWSGNTSCTATRTCSLCQETETETVNATSVTSGNTITYTATFSNSAFTAQTKTVTLDADLVVDTLNAALTGVEGSNSYASWTEKQDQSYAIYAGNSAVAADSGALQLRSNNNNSGIVTVYSGGTVRSITVVFNTATVVGRKVSIYVSAVPFVSPEDLYASGAIAVAELVYAEGTTEYTYSFEEDHAYVAIRSANGAIFLDEVTVVWDPTDASAITDADKVEFEQDALKIAGTANETLPSTGATFPSVSITWASSNSAVVSVVNGKIVIDNSSLTEAATVTLTATLALNNTVRTKTFTVEVEAPSGIQTWELTFPSYNDNGVGSYTATWTATVGTQVWTLTNFNNNQSAWAYVKCGSKNSASVGTISTSLSEAVESVAVTIDALTASKVNGITLTVTAGATTHTYSVTAAVGTQTVTIPAAERIENATYTLSFDCQQGSSNGLVTVSKVLITEGEAGSGTGGDPNPGGDPTETPSGDTVTDTLTSANFAATSTSYTDFTYASNSGVTFVGQSAKSSAGGIQLRSKNSNSGIVTTTTVGKIVSITITVESGSNTVQIYGKNTAYSAATDLYDTSLQGTLIGSCTETGTITITGDYEYIGIRSANGALYITSIEIVWG